MKFHDQSRYCHAERSEASLCPSSETLRGVYPERSERAQGDKPFPILVGKKHYRPTANPPHPRMNLLQLIKFIRRELHAALLVFSNPQYTFIHQFRQACFDQRVLPIALWMVRQTI
jgi:hypothetical protein